MLFDPDYHLISKNNTITLSTSDFNFNSDITLYPNPTTSVIHIEKPEHIEIKDIKVYNSLGQLLLQQRWTPELDLNTLASGILFVQFQTEDQIINKRIIKI